MTPHAVRQLNPTLAQKAKDDHAYAQTLSEGLPNPREGKPWCQPAICRALHLLGKDHFKLRWKLVDGFFLTIRTFHSWLEVEVEASATRLLLDPFPHNALSGPALYNISASDSPWHTVFRPGVYDSLRISSFENQALGILSLASPKVHRLHRARA